MPCWWQLHGTHVDRGPLPGFSRVNPGAHCSQNCPAKPRGQEQDSTHGAEGPLGLDVREAEDKVTFASCDVSEGEEKQENSFFIKLMLTKVSGKLVIVALEAC